MLTDAPADARVVREEIFGPVAVIRAFGDEDEALALANATESGLVAYLYTRDLDRAVRMSEALETGMVGLNRGYVSDPGAPFGGVKQSGVGREGGNSGIEEYLEQRYVALDVPADGRTDARIDARTDSRPGAPAPVPAGRGSGGRP